MSRKFSLGRKRKGYWKKQESINLLDSYPDAPAGWTLQKDQDRIVYFCAEMQETMGPQVIITRSVAFQSTGTWAISIHGKEIDAAQCPALSGFPRAITTCDSISSFLTSLGSLHICCGNPDQKFIPLADSRKGVFKNQRGTAITAYREHSYPVRDKSARYTSTICSSNCHFLLATEGYQCSSCQQHRRTLLTLLNRLGKGETETAKLSSTNLRYLTTPEKKEKYKSMRSTIVSQSHENLHLRKELSAALQKLSVTLQEGLCDDIAQIARENEDTLDSLIPDGSPMRLLWEQQKKVLSVNSTSGMRWHPLLVKWCLSLKLKSPAAYRTLKESGFLILPSERTLRDYTHYMESGPGYRDDVDVHLSRLANLDSSPPYQKLVVVTINKMKIKEDLVFNKHSGNLVGFVDFGSADKSLQSLIPSEVRRPSIASHMLVVMVRFLFKNLNFVYAVFPTVVTAGYEIYSALWEGIGRLEILLGLKVR